MGKKQELQARAPFDPTDPFDAMSETIRCGVTQVDLQALQTTLYKELDSAKQIECFLAGALTGTIGACFYRIKPEGRDAIMQYIAECLPIARQIVEEIERNNP